MKRTTVDSAYESQSRAIQRDLADKIERDELTPVSWAWENVADIRHDPSGDAFVYRWREMTRVWK